MAGLKGAAIGGLSGAAAGLGTFVLGAIALSSTTLTFPLAFGILTVSGVSSWFGGKWTTSYFLGENIVQELEVLNRLHGKRFEPSKYLLERVKNKKTLRD